MGVFTRADSPYFHLYLETTGKREPTDIRRDAPTVEQRKDAKERARKRYHDRLKDTELGSPTAITPITLADFVTWYRAHVLPKHRGAEREGAALTRLLEAFGPLPLTDITRSRVTEWHTTRRRSVSASSVNRETDVLKAVLHAAVPEYLAASALYGMKRLTTTTPRRTLLSEKDEAKLLAVMDIEDAALFVLGLDSLIRLQDLLDITREHHRGATIWIADPKAGGGFEVPVSTRARALLKKIPDDGSGYYFSRRRKAKTEHGRRNAVKQMLKRYCRLANVKYGRNQGGITFHWATRRTGATRMLSRNIPTANVQKVGRWKRPDTVLTMYHELIGKDAHAAVNAVGPQKPRSRSRSVPATPVKRKNAKRNAR